MNPNDLPLTNNRPFFVPGGTLYPGSSGTNPSVAYGPRLVEFEYAIRTSVCGLAHFASSPISSLFFPRPSMFDWPARM